MATIKKIKKASTKVETPVEEKVKDEIIEEEEILEENDRDDAIRKAIRKANASVKKFPGEKLPNDDIDDEDIIDEEEETLEEDDIEEEEETPEEDDIEEEEETPKKKVTKKNSSKKPSKKVEEETPEEDDIEEEENSDSEDEKSIFNSSNRPKNNIPNRGNIKRISKEDLLKIFMSIFNKYLDKRGLNHLSKKENEEIFNFVLMTYKISMSDWEKNLIETYGSFEKVPESERKTLISFFDNKSFKLTITEPRRFPDPKNPQSYGYYSDWGTKVSFDSLSRDSQKIVNETKTYFELEDGTKIPKK